MRNTAILIFLLGLVGCSNPDLGQVTGIVTYENEPLADATVAFSPQSPGGVFAVARTDEQGRYLLAAPIKRGVTRGALAGQYNVTITKREIIPSEDETLYAEGKISYDELQQRMSGKKGDQTRTIDHIPTRYGRAETSELRADVKAKTQNEFNFDLKK